MKLSTIQQTFNTVTFTVTLYIIEQNENNVRCLFCSLNSIWNKRSLINVYYTMHHAQQLASDFAVSVRTIFDVLTHIKQGQHLKRVEETI